MVLDPKQTTVAYRCPHCGGGVMSFVDVFALSADLLKLKCTCGKSELSVRKRSDGTMELTVPCIFCPNPHRFTLSENVFFGKDLFTLSCPYTGANIGMIGEQNHVKAELARTELELLDWMEQAGIQSLDSLHADKTSLPDEQALDAVLFVIKELDTEGKIFCKCDPESADYGERQFDAEILDDGIRVTCSHCGATRLIPTDSLLGAHAFLECDSLYLE